MAATVLLASAQGWLLWLFLIFTVNMSGSRDLVDLGGTGVLRPHNMLHQGLPDHHSMKLGFRPGL